MFLKPVIVFDRIRYESVCHVDNKNTAPEYDSRTNSTRPARLFSIFGGYRRWPSRGRRAVAGLFPATVRRPRKNAPQGRFFFDADVALKNAIFIKRYLI